jgi:hypothetical protein
MNKRTLALTNPSVLIHLYTARSLAAPSTLLTQSHFLGEL